MLKIQETKTFEFITKDTQKFNKCILTSIKVYEHSLQNCSKISGSYPSHSMPELDRHFYAGRINVFK